MAKQVPDERWIELQSDPDNWVEIPEFGANPLEIGFQGFSLPIVNPRTYRVAWLEDVRLMVAAVRSTARATFSTMGALRRASFSAFEVEQDDTLGIDPTRFDKAQILAVRYTAFFYGVERVVSESNFRRVSLVRNLASIGADAVSIVGQREFSSDEVARLARSMRSDTARAGAHARHARDPKQTDKERVHTLWQEWQSDPTRYRSKARFATDMLTKFESLTSARVIERWCRDWEALSQRR